MRRATQYVPLPRRTAQLRRVAIKREGIAWEQVPDIIPDGEPHLTLNDTHPRRDRVGVRLDNRPRSPLSLQDLVESLRARLLRKSRK